MNEERTTLLLQQTENTHGHLLDKYSVTVNQDIRRWESRSVFGTGTKGWRVVIIIIRKENGDKNKFTRTYSRNQP